MTKNWLNYSINDRHEHTIRFGNMRGDEYTLDFRYSASSPAGRQESRPTNLPAGRQVQIHNIKPLIINICILCIIT
ncbi:MAG: hypothetical protein KF679_05855 [Chitinophagaceae bacterium]|nr:hypothetical protein [Chitinophagaceae bacterium]